MKLPADVVARLRSHYEGRAVCVTGGAGFIGGHLVDALLSLGASIAVLDDEAVDDAVRGSRTVFHLAALGSVPRSIAEPQRTWSVNATGTVRILEGARRAWPRGTGAGKERVVLAASSAAYGDDPALPKVETQPPRPLSPYAASKLAGEHALQSWARSYGLSTASLRYFNVFGPRQPADSAYAAVIPAFARRLLAGEAPVINGDGTISRDFTGVTNAVLATLLAGGAERPLAGEVFNVGTGRAVTLNELAAIMAEKCAVPHIAPEHESPRAGDVPHSLADFSRAREALGYAPVQSLEDGLDETLAWMKQSMAGTARP